MKHIHTFLKSGYIVLLLSLAQHSYAQSLKSSLYSFTLSYKNDKTVVNTGTYLSGFNPLGYNNQVSFISADEILFSSNLESSEVTDIYLANIRLRKLERITANGLSSYSPDVVPTKDYYSCVRVASDKTTQHLWVYPKDRSNMGFSPIPDIKNVGYYCWVNPEMLALFLVDSSNKLVLVDLSTKQITEIAQNIGRCLKVNKDGELVFVQKSTDNQWYLKAYNPDSQKIRPICLSLQGAEDFVLTRDDKILMGSSSTLYQYDPKLDYEWKSFYDFKDYGIQNISRIALRNNKLIIVNNE